MEKNYTFVFYGTREDLFERVKTISNYNSYNNKYFYFNDYIVGFDNETIRFGVERGGHSGGYWYVPDIVEYPDRLEFCGKIKYIGPEGERGKVGKVIDKIGECLLLIFLLPVVIVLRIYFLLEWIMRKISKNPKAKEKTTEERLYDLMENNLGCVKKEKL